MYETIFLETELTYNPWNDIYVKELRRFYLWIKNNVIIFLHEKRRLFFASLLFDIFVKKKETEKKKEII